jgi:UDP:flavonoid glycosyltransferase YjiC (YdhE family)
MRVAIATVGTTGDVRPFAALARGLRLAGHDVTAVSWALHREAFEAVDAHFLAAGPTTSWEDIRETAERATRARSPLAQVEVLRDFHLREAESHYRRLREVLPGHDVVIIHAIHSLAEAAARDLGIRWASAVFDPTLLPTGTAPPPGLPNLGPINRFSWRLLDRLLRRLDGPLHRVMTAAGSATGPELTIFRARSPFLHLVACSPAIMAVPTDLPATVHVTGVWTSPDPPASLPGELEAFLAAAEPPVVVSFGSMAAGDPAQLTATVRDAIGMTGVRAVVQAGAAGLSTAAIDGVYQAGAVDHRALLPRASAIIHHGGAGTTHAAVAAGIPSVVVPHIGDQAYWAARLHRLGVAPKPLPGSRLSAASLADRIRQAVGDGQMRGRASALAERIASEHGTDAAVRLVETLPSR